MANTAKIRIEFDRLHVVGFEIRIELRQKSFGALVEEIVEVSVDDRIAPNQYERGIYTTNESHENLGAALSADYTGVKFQTVTNSSYVELIANAYDREFIYTGDVDGLTITITDEVEPDPVFAITSSTIQPPQVESICNFQRVKMTVENGVGPYTITWNSRTKGPITNEADLWVEMVRYPVGFVSITDSENNSDSITVADIAKYDIESVQVELSLSGATITIIRETISPGSALNVQYSLDNDTYQNSNTFTGILPGTYTAYLRDSFGCISSLEFTVSALEMPRPAPSFVIEKANPLRFVNSAEPVIRNVNNTLYNNQNIPNLENYYFRQPFNIGTVVRTQIKTPYRDLTASIIDECTGEVSQTITPTLEIENIGQTDKRDCYLRVNDKTGNFIIYFPQGNIYDTETGDVISSYSSRGQLPSFAKVGMYVTLESDITGIPDGTIEVIDIIYKDYIGFWCIEINSLSPFPSYAVIFGAICVSTYNAEEYNVHEFAFTENKGQYRVEIEATDENSNYSDLVYSSEPFYFDVFLDVVTIKYFSDDNQSGINYQTGIIFTINVPGRLFNYSQAGDDETFEDDYGNKQIQKAVYIEQLELESSLIPKYLAEKVVIASTHENLTIDGITVTMADRPEVESKGENNNPMYTVIGIYQVDNRVIRDERTGVVSSDRAVIGSDDNGVIGV